MQSLRQNIKKFCVFIPHTFMSVVVNRWLVICPALITATQCWRDYRAVWSSICRVENAAARLVCDLHPHDHMTPALKQLHWLPIKSRIVYKLCLLMHNIPTGQAPQYLADCVSNRVVIFPSALSALISHSPFPLTWRRAHNVRTHDRRRWPSEVEWQNN